MKRILLSIGILLCACAAHAQTFTRSMLFQQNQQGTVAYPGSVSSFLPQGAVSPAALFSMFNNLIQGTGILSDNNTWSGTNIFTGTVSGVSATLAVGTSPITGTCTNGYNLYSNGGILGCQANGSGGSGSSISYPTHANLVANAKTQTGPPLTILQQGFTSTGDGGDASYQWNAISYCPLGTSGSPTTADYIICVLPIGQSASTAGRYILSRPTGGLDVRALGFQANGPDNVSLVPTLMAALGPSGTVGGYDVIFAGIAGQPRTPYYFSNSFVQSRLANYRCSGGSGQLYNSVELVFASGVQGVVQENGSYTSDGQYGGGITDGCSIWTLSYGSANTTQSSSTLTSAVLNADPSGLIHASTWSVGDGIIVASSYDGFLPYTSVPAVAPGAYLSNVVGSTLTLASGYTTAPILFGYASALFPQIGTNNFVTGDTIQAGNDTYTATTSGSPATGQFQIGATFAKSVGCLAVMINTNSSGSNANCAWGAPTTTPNITAQNFIYNSLNNLVFTAITSGTAGNSLTAIYTPAGTAAVSFVQLYLASTTSFGLGAASLTTPMVVWQLPVSLKFTVQTTSGSNSMLVTAGPRLLVPGDVIWSDAFPFGTTVLTVSGILGNQTVTLDNSFHNAAGQNALVTHTSGSPGQLWVMPAALKRDVQAKAANNSFVGWPIGLEMSCSADGGINCTGSHDTFNVYFEDLIGRWTGGDNTSASDTYGEEGAKNYMLDYFNGATLGEVDVNWNSNSNEGGQSPYAIAGNCINDNFSSMFGGYIASFGLGGCATVAGIYPITSGAPWLFFSPQETIPLGAHGIEPGLMLGQWEFNNNQCIILGGVLGTIQFSNDCQTNDTWSVTWNATNKAWYLIGEGVEASAFINSNTGYTGYSGAPTYSYEGFLTGLLLYNTEGIGFSANNSRIFSAGVSIPTGTWHVQGDTQINTAPIPGSSLLWTDVPIATTTLSAGVTKGTTTSVAIGACPTVTPATGTVIDDTTANPPKLLGTFSSCSTGTLTFQAAASNNGTNGDTIAFMQFLTAGIVQDSIPVISSCGTSPAIGAGSNNLGGSFELGTGSPTACTITFAHAYPNHAFCTYSPTSSGGAAISGGDYISAISNAGFTLTLGTGTSSISFTYTCSGN